LTVAVYALSFYNFTPTSAPTPVQDLTKAPWGLKNLATQTYLDLAGKFTDEGGWCVGWQKNGEPQQSEHSLYPWGCSLMAFQGLIAFLFQSGYSRVCRLSTRYAYSSFNFLRKADPTVSPWEQYNIVTNLQASTPTYVSVNTETPTLLTGSKTAKSWTLEPVANEPKTYR